MREILFRGKRKVCDEWVYGFPFISRKSEYKIKWYDGYYGSSKTSEIYPESIGQFTGLTDKNGKKIFEGDIVQGKDRLEKHLEVFGYIDHKNGSFVITGDFMTHYRWLDYEVEVIGNIHDNPELLENP